MSYIASLKLAVRSLLGGGRRCSLRVAGKGGVVASHRAACEPLEERRLLALDVIDLATMGPAGERFPLELNGTADASPENPQLLFTTERVQISTLRDYELSARGVNVSEYDDTPLVYASYDIDGNLIEPLHVTKYSLAADTHLAATLAPGDSTIWLTYANGWSNDAWEPAHTRSIAWYGYRDSLGNLYRDYSYTQNVASDLEDGLWEPGGIEFDHEALAFRLTLREPWAGPTLEKGAAVRNAASGPLYQEPPVDVSIETSGSWVEYSATFGGQTWFEGQADPRTFRPGTVFIQPALVTVAAWDDVAIGATNVSAGPPIEMPQPPPTTIQASDDGLFNGAWLYETLAGETLNVGGANLPGLLANDSGGSGPLAVCILTLPSHGSLEWNENGTFEYTPNDGFTGIDTFTYEANDGSTGSKAVAAIRVVASNEVLATNSLDGVSAALPGELPAYGQRQSELQSIAVAMHDYHADFARFPPSHPSQFDENGLPRLSWRVYILPYLGYDDLFDRFHLDEPWDSQHNLGLLDQMPDVLRSDGDAADTGLTRVVQFTGPGAPFLARSSGNQFGPRLEEIRDGISNTIMFVEAGPEAATPWTKPTDVPFKPSNPIAPLGELGANFLAAMFDGSVRTFSTQMPASLLAARITPAAADSLDDPSAAPSAAGVTIIQTGGDTTFSEVGADEFFVVLDQQPERLVVLNISSPLLINISTPQIVKRPTVIFTPADWDIPQRIVVRTQNDLVLNGTRTEPITISVDQSDSDAPFDTVADQTFFATILDDETESPTHWVIDNLAPGFDTTGDWTFYPYSGIAESVHYSAAGGGDVAKWTFDDLEPGLYRVSATWSTHANRATNSPFYVFDGTTKLGKERLNQQLAPDDFRFADRQWEDIGDIWTITSNQLMVKLKDDANGFVIADAIRIERLGDLPGSFAQSASVRAADEVFSRLGRA